MALPPLGVVIAVFLPSLIDEPLPETRPIVSLATLDPVAREHPAPPEPESQIDLAALEERLIASDFRDAQARLKRLLAEHRGQPEFGALGRLDLRMRMRNSPLAAFVDTPEAPAPRDPESLVGDPTQPFARRRAVAQSLAQDDSLQAQAQLEGLVTTADPHTRRWLMSTWAANAKGASASAAFVRLLADEDPHVVAQAARALGSAPAAAEDLLAHLATEDQPLVQQACLEALARCGQPRHLPALAKLKTSPRPLTGSPAASARQICARTETPVPGWATARMSLHSPQAEPR